MTIRLFIIFILSLPCISFGQDLSDSLLATFYNKTLTIYFTDSTINEGQKKFGDVLLQTDLNTEFLKKNIAAEKFKFFNSRTNLHSILDKPLKKNTGRNIYRIKHKYFGQDTVDINIGVQTIEKISKKQITLGAGCGGGMGYIPDGRFIYSRETNGWTFISGQEILNEKLSKFWKK